MAELSGLAAAEALGGIDILVSNAGVGAAGTVADNRDDEWHRVFDVASPVVGAAVPRDRRAPAAR